MVPADPLSIAFVRHAMQSFSEAYTAEKIADLALVFTELVTNAIVHTGLTPNDAIEIRLTLGSDHVSGAVIDTGPGFDPDVLGPHPAGSGGFGLFIVARLTKRWGVDVRDGRTTVWFEL
jgi:anti-sigma regulatory factor (Ser/Thr protein kinase)